jgi:small-conductance mechanosensitive channel
MKRPSSIIYYHTRTLIRIVVPGLFLIYLLVFIRSGFARTSLQEVDGEPTPTLASEAVSTPLPGVPVSYKGEILFYVRVGRGGLSNVERAAVIENRINDLATNPFMPEIDIVLAESSEGTELLAGDMSLFTVTDQDAEAMGMTRQEAAQKAAEIIQNAIDHSRQIENVRARIARIASLLGIILGLTITYAFMNGINQRFDKQIDVTPTEVAQKGIIYRTRYYRSGEWKRLAKSAIKFIKWVVFLLIVIIGLPVILRLFPATVDLADRIIAFLATPLRIAWTWMVDNIDNFVVVGLIAVFFYLLIRFSSYIFSEIGDGNIRFSGFDPEWANFTNRIVSFLLIAVAVIVAFPYIPGSDSPAFRGITVFLGALFTLSSTAAVTNIVAGVIQTYTGAFRNGDVIRIGDVVGVVLEKRLLTTRVLTPKNEEVSIPNGTVLNSNVINYSTMARENKLILSTTITIGYDVPWQKVHELMISAAKNTPDVLHKPVPFVLQTSLNDFHISYQLNCYTNNPKRMVFIYSELHANIQDQFNRAGVEIMSPAFTAFRGGDESTIPALVKDNTG